jgi:hypothetical protein
MANRAKLCSILTGARKIFKNHLLRKKMKRLIAIAIGSIAIGSLLMPINSYANSSFTQSIIATNKQSTSISRGNAGGIRYEVRGSGNTNVSSVNNSIRIVSGRNTVTINKGRIALNGKDRGVIKTGDSVLLDVSGRLYVNGKKR